MKVKKYVVDSMTSALQQIRLELGEHAVILNTKELKTGGFLGFFTKRKIEVVAAVPSVPHAEGAKRPGDQRPEPRAEGRMKQKTMGSVPAEDGPPEKWPPVNKPMEPRPAEAKQVESAKPHAASLAGSSQDEVMKEIQGMKEMLMSLVIGEGTPQSRLPRSLERWVHRLKDQEVDQDVIHFIVESLLKKNPQLHLHSEEEVGLKVHGIIVKLLEEGIEKEPQIERSVNLVSFVGPTGVGKTTTIAKLAAEQVLSQSRRVGMLTTDTYRIAAVEQLKTYANILNVPLETVFSPDGLKKAIKHLHACDLIFMDTAGRNYQDAQYIQEISRYLAEPMIQENVLILSMTSKYRDMKSIVENFNAIPIDKIILTKIDETTTYGAILNLVYHFPYPVVYITTGQSVPDDIMKAEPGKLANMILGVDWS